MVKHSSYSSMKKLLTVLSIIFIATSAHAKTYTIDHVISGDIIMLTNGKMVRLLGIDTPESEYDALVTGLDVETVKRIEQEAKDYLTNYIDQLPNKKIILEFDVDKKDRHSQTGRWQAYVFWDASGFKERPIESSQHFDNFKGKHRHFINATMVKIGYATPMFFDPNIKYKELFDELHEEARQHKRGLWRESQHLKEEGTGVEDESDKLVKGVIAKESIVKVALDLFEGVLEKDPSLEEAKVEHLKKAISVREPTKEEKQYYDNGTLKLHMALFNEEDFEGFWREYYTTGALKVDAKLLKIKGGCSEEGGIPIEGLAREYHINGQLKQAGEYKNNCEEGSHKYYSYEGNLEEELYYEKGELVWRKQYDSNIQVYTENSKELQND